MSPSGQSQGAHFQDSQAKALPVILVAIYSLSPNKCVSGSQWVYGPHFICCCLRAFTAKGTQQCRLWGASSPAHHGPLLPPPGYAQL